MLHVSYRMTIPRYDRTIKCTASFYTKTLTGRGIVFVCYSRSNMTDREAEREPEFCSQYKANGNSVIASFSRVSCLRRQGFVRRAVSSIRHGVSICLSFLQPLRKVGRQRLRRRERLVDVCGKNAMVRVDIQCSVVAETRAVTSTVTYLTSMSLI